MSYKIPRTSKYKLLVKRSSAGLGLFIENNISKEKFIVEYFGPLLSNEDADKKGGKYLFELNKNWTIDGVSRENIARYINHSCKPNCYAEMDGRRVFIYSKRKIQKREELSYHYGKSYFKDWIKPYGCKCVKCIVKDRQSK